jgi:hypothetical protein
VIPPAVTVIEGDPVVVNVYVPAPTLVEVASVGVAGPAGPPGADGAPGPQGPPGVWVQMTQAAYDALPVKDPNTLYVIVG